MRLLQLPVEDEDGRIPHRAVGEGLWQSRSHREEAFLLWLPLIEATLLALFKKPLFKATPFVVGPSSQCGGRVGFRDSHRRVAGKVRGFLLCNCISFQVTPCPDQDPTDAGTLNRKIIHLDHNELVMSPSETCRNWEALSAKALGYLHPLNALKDGSL